MSQEDTDVIAIRRQMSPLHLRRWDLSRRLARFMERCDSARQPAWLYEIEHQEYRARAGVTFEQARLEAFANLFCVQTTTLSALLKGELVNAWAWDLVEWCVRESGPIPTWPEAKRRKDARR